MVHTSTQRQWAVYYGGEEWITWLSDHHHHLMQCALHQHGCIDTNGRRLDWITLFRNTMLRGMFLLEWYYQYRTLQHNSAQVFLEVPVVISKSATLGNDELMYSITDRNSQLTSSCKMIPGTLWMGAKHQVWHCTSPRCASSPSPSPKTILGH